ncbi:GNAT family N-acetyltransferase [Macrococcoides canis]|uniref:GNAT family N-acetyltransferase n=1 Tax=Macrococcoides canis TaxID=1855823 RepID=UPI0013E911EB|nr:GNAT family N-acetyltransferase [Macrococcus canis]
MTLGEIGYFIDEQYSSKGIMTLALNTVLEYSFSQLKLNKIELYIYENNIASCRLAEKFNFKLEGKLREVLKTDNNYLNQNVYGLLNSEHIKQ